VSVRWLAMSLLIPAEAISQTYCDGPGEPYISSAYTADYDKMKRTADEIEEYVEDMNAYVDCLRNEHDDAQSELSNVLSDWESAVRRFETQ
jgi:hypothetical protein